MFFTSKGLRTIQDVAGRIDGRHWMLMQWLKEHHRAKRESPRQSATEGLVRAMRDETKRLFDPAISARDQPLLLLENSG
jgi:hypothetical protein